MKRISKIFIILSIVLMLCFSATGCTFVFNGQGNYGNGEQSQINSYQASQNVEFGKEQERVQISLVEAIAKVRKSAVMIKTNKGSGSGVIVDMKAEQGTYLDNNNFVFVLTCHHVIANASSLEIYIPDENYAFDNEDFIFAGQIGSKISPKANQAVSLVGGDKEADIAVLKIDISKPAKSGKVLSLEKICKAKVVCDNNYKPSMGETVFAIGNPTGDLPGTALSGIISFLEREATVAEVGDMLLMQINVLTHPGSSGGALYNLYGELIGITNAGNTSNAGMNYAIPYVLSNGNGFKSIAAQLVATATADNYGYVAGRKAKFGFVASQIENVGIVVSSVESGSFAESAGLKVEDIIESVSVKENGSYHTWQPITKNSELSSIIGSLKIGDKFKLKVVRQVESLVFPGSAESKEIEIELEVKVYWFCDTGIYPN